MATLPLMTRLFPRGLLVGHRHLADDPLNLTHLDLRNVGPDVFAVRSAFR